MPSRLHDLEDILRKKQEHIESKIQGVELVTKNGKANKKV